MTFYFKTFRKALSSVVLFVLVATVVVALLTLPSFTHRAVPWLLFTIEILSFIRTLWSMTSKPFFNTFQSVAAEAVGLFGLFPFHLILALMVTTTKFKDETSPVLGVLLQTSVITTSAIHTAYTVCLIAAAVITAYAFDDNVWIRDIDSSPSPFPVSILFAFLYDRIFVRWRRGASELNAWKPNGENLAHGPCLSPCSCPPKPESELRGPQPGDPELDKTDRSVKTRSLPWVLVQVPGAAERRTSIAISLEVR